MIGHLTIWDVRQSEALGFNSFSNLLSSQTLSRLFPLPVHREMPMFSERPHRRTHGRPHGRMHGCTHGRTLRAIQAVAVIIRPCQNSRRWSESDSEKVLRCWGQVKQDAKCNIQRHANDFLGLTQRARPTQMLSHYTMWNYAWTSAELLCWFRMACW